MNFVKKYLLSNEAPHIMYSFKLFSGGSHYDNLVHSQIISLGISLMFRSRI